MTDEPNPDPEWIHMATTWDSHSKITRVYIDGVRYPQFPRRLGWLAHLIWRIRRWRRGPIEGDPEPIG